MARQQDTLNPVLVTPVSAKGSPVLVVFASGDGGLTGVGKTIIQHLADGGKHHVAGFKAPARRCGRSRDRATRWTTPRRSTTWPG